MNPQPPKIDPEFRSLIPPLTEDERELLKQQLQEEGCLESLTVWKDTGILLDGHNRLDICEEIGVGYKVKHLSFPDRDAAMSWMIRHQLGRRNITSEQASYLRGKRYLLEKKNEGRPENSDNVSEFSSGETAERIAQETNVTGRTIERDAKFAKAVDQLKEKAGAEAVQKILAGKMSKKEIAQAAELPKSEAKKIVYESTIRTHKTRKTSSESAVEPTHAVNGRPPEPPPVPTDADDNPIPEKVRAAFTVAKELEGVCREIDAIIKRVQDYSIAFGGRLIRMSSFEQQMTAAKGNLWANRATHVCGYCNGESTVDGKPCAGCKGEGWTAKHVYEQTPGKNKKAKRKGE